VRRLAAAAACAVLAAAGAGCGSDPHDPGDAHARQVLAMAAHGRSIADEMGAAARALITHTSSARDTRLVVEERLAEARLLQEDVESLVPLGAPGRVPALSGARELVLAGGYMHSLAAGHTAALALARRHLHAAAGALAGAARVLRPALTGVQEQTLAHLEAPPPRVP
jgi:hypothetical protein